MTTTPAASPLSDAQFHTLTSALLSGLEATLDRWLQQDTVDIDAMRNGGVLDMTLPDGSHIVVNTQPPLHEIWLAARSGGFHYRWVDGVWRSTRDGGEFFADLSRCVSAQAGQALEFVAI
jgi:CyaY protein